MPLRFNSPQRVNAKCFAVFASAFGCEETFKRRHQDEQRGGFSFRLITSPTDHLRQCGNLFFACIIFIGRELQKAVRVDNRFAGVGAAHEFCEPRIV